MIYRFENWMFGCTCFGPCHHKHGRLQEWFWNTNRLYPLAYRLFNWLTGQEPFEG
jgi:hypothetical protein